jgi:predicted alpha-1,2-mannosidase
VRKITWSAGRLVGVLSATAAAFSGCGGHVSTSTIHPNVASIPLPGGPSAFVDPFMGTGVGGSSVGSINTFPGADVPFGMLQWSPDTAPDRTSGGGYAYRDTSISGFSLTHLSGPGCPVYGDIPILPFVGAITGDPATMRSPFSHRAEVAHPGSYAVTVGRSPVRVELAVGPRTGLGRFTFPGSGPTNVLFKVAASAAGSERSAVTIVGDRELEGSVTSGHFCDTAGTYRLYFAARFNRSFQAFGTWHDTTVTPAVRTSTDAKSGAYVTFGDTTRVVELQVAVSFVSVAGALANLDAEAPGWSIGALRDRATSVWNQFLGRIAVSGGSLSDERTFYSALYRSLLHPNVFGDDNGYYIGFDHNVHVAHGYTQYANLSGWDIYRCEVPLLAVVAPIQTGDMVTSLLADAAQGGGLPKWPVANSESAQINGDSADPIIAAAYAFGARNFDVSTALSDMVRGATDPNVANGGHPERQDLAEYLAKGYVQADRRDLTSLDYTVGASETLEYAIDDFAIAQLALATGHINTSQAFLTRAQNWRHLVNPATGFLAARRADGSFPPGPAFQPSPLPGIGQDGFEEGNAIQYTWSVPQNIRGLFDALGGNATVVNKLDNFFTELNTSRKQPYDWAGNEPGLGIPWEYDYAGAPWRTQDVVRRIATSVYSATPNGEPGNDDLGAMASWFVWAAVGLYPEVPGRGELVLSSPLFQHISISLSSGGSIVIDAPGAPDAGRYLQALQVQGIVGAASACISTPAPGVSSYKCPWLPSSVTQIGGRLSFGLGSSPNTAWGTDPAEAPPSFGDGEPGS